MGDRTELVVPVAAGVLLAGARWWLGCCSDWLKAAAMLESTALHEPLEDRNLFFAWLVAEVFLNTNGVYLQYEPDDAFALVLRAKHKSAGVQEIAAQLRAWATA